VQERNRRGDPSCLRSGTVTGHLLWG